MPDPDYLALRGRLAQAQDEMRDAEARVTNAVDVLRKKIILFANPEEIEIAAVRAAVEDLAEERGNWIRLRDETNGLKSRLGMR